MCQGPEAIGQTGDSSYNTLFGRTWGLLFCEDSLLLFLQWNEATQGWDEVTENLPSLGGFTGDERSFSLAFNQTARDRLRL